MPVDAVLLQPALSLPTFDFAKALVVRLDNARRLTREAMEAAAEHQRKVFDEGREHPKVTVGDAVRLRARSRSASKGSSASRTPDRSTGYQRSEANCCTGWQI
jgi:hypothetical protein